MKFRLPLLRFLGMALALLAATCARGDDLEDWTAGTTVAPGSTAPPKKADSSSVTLAPAVEKKLTELLDKAKAQKADTMDTQMKKKVDAIAKTTGLNDAGSQTLIAASKQAVAASLDNWAPQLPDLFRNELAVVPPDQAVVMLGQAEEQIGMVAMMLAPGKMVAPDEQDTWTKALKQTLTPAQFDAWTQSEAKHKAEVEKQIDDALKVGVDREHDDQTQAMAAECHRIETSLNLPRDQAGKLDALGKTVVDQSVASWRKQMEDMALKMDDDQRKPYLANGLYMGVMLNESPTKESAWKEGLAKILTADEVARLDNTQDARKARRAQVMSQLMLMLLDDKLALTAAQRQKLQPIAERLVKVMSPMDENRRPGNPQMYSSIPPETFYQLTTQVGPDELKPILDEAQMQRWKELPTQDNPVVVSPFNAAGTSCTGTGPEDVEKAVSSYFYEKAKKERERSLEANTLKAEGIARVTGLNANSSEVLHVAALGATEQYLTSWKWFTEQQIRGQLQDLTPQNVKQRLAGIQDFFFSGGNFGGNNRNDDAIWDETVQTVLTPAQQDALKKETDARTDFHASAIAGVVLAELDSRSQLAPGQWDKLEPLVQRVVAEYNAGISQVFSGMNGNGWYLGGPYVLIPLAGIDEKDLKSILTKDQMDVWTGSQDFANATNMWQVIKQTQAQRVRHGNARGMILQD